MTSVVPSSAQTPTATASWPAQRCRSPGTSPAEYRLREFSSKARISCIWRNSASDCATGGSGSFACAALFRLPLVESFIAVCIQSWSPNWSLRSRFAQKFFEQTDLRPEHGNNFLLTLPRHPARDGADADCRVGRTVGVHDREPHRDYTGGRLPVIQGIAPF